MAEQRFTVGDEISVLIAGTMTGITADGTLTVQYASDLGACETDVELEGTAVIVMHQVDADKVTPVLIEERDDARVERDRLVEQVKRATDLRLIRLAISDPGAFVKRERFNDGDYETVPAWGARAVVMALQEGRGNR